MSAQSINDNNLPRDAANSSNLKEIYGIVCIWISNLFEDFLRNFSFLFLLGNLKSYPIIVLYQKRGFLTLERGFERYQLLRLNAIFIDHTFIPQKVCLQRIVFQEAFRYYHKKNQTRLKRPHIKWPRKRLWDEKNASSHRKKNFPKDAKIFSVFFLFTISIERRKKTTSNSFHSYAFMF